MCIILNVLIAIKIVRDVGPSPLLSNDIIIYVFYTSGSNSNNYFYNVLSTGRQPDSHQKTINKLLSEIH